MRKKLVVDVDDGLFKNERTVSFRTPERIVLAGQSNAMGRRHEFLVDSRQIEDGNKIYVYVIRSDGEIAVIELPSETFAGDTIVRVPEDMLI